MNVVFISPNFPERFYNFCDRLKRLGVNVLGIGDCPYEALERRVVDSLAEYYYLPSLENYDDVYRAVAFYISKYGRVDYVESQNEYWLELEAKLREDFNIPGLKPATLESVKRKSKMKAGYAAAGVKTARYLLLDARRADGDQYARLKEFTRDVGYPIVVKPDSGVGASDTWKIANDGELESFWRERRDVDYIAEEFVPGRVETFDGVANARGDILFATGQVMLTNPMDMALYGTEAISYTTDVKATGLWEVGARVLKAFDVKSRFFHFEFFRLLEDRAGLGEKGDILGLEVNMRAPGGYIPDKMNYAYDVDVYRIWAESLVFQENRSFRDYRFKYYVAHVGRRDGVAYARSLDEIRARYSEKLVLEREPPKSINGTMGSRVFLLRSTSVDELEEQAAFILAHNESN